jgi:single-strand DNA-binding protein
MNNVNIIGRVASDPLKYHIDQFQKNVVKFALAFDNRTRKTDGVKDTFFIDVEAWDKVADRIYEVCQKGDKVGITGHLEQAKFVRRDGTKGSSIKIVVSGVEFLFDRREKEIKVNEEVDDEAEYEFPEDTTLPL